MNIYHVRRSLYRTASILGDAQAVDQSIRQRSAAPVARRIARKNIYRAEGRLTRSILRKAGL